MSPSSTCAIRAAKTVRRTPSSLSELPAVKYFVANRSFGSTTQSRRPVQQRICTISLNNTERAISPPSGLRRTQPQSIRSFSNTPPRCALKTVQQIKARSKSGVSHIDCFCSIHAFFVPVVMLTDCLPALQHHRRRYFRPHRVGPMAILQI
jgi:hypothetical protein